MTSSRRSGNFKPRKVTTALQCLCPFRQRAYTATHIRNNRTHEKVSLVILRTKYTRSADAHVSATSCGTVRAVYFVILSRNNLLACLDLVASLKFCFKWHLFFTFSWSCCICGGDHLLETGNWNRSIFVALHGRPVEQLKQCTYAFRSAVVLCDSALLFPVSIDDRMSNVKLIWRTSIFAQNVENASTVHTYG